MATQTIKVYQNQAESMAYKKVRKTFAKTVSSNFKIFPASAIEGERK